MWFTVLLQCNAADMPPLCVQQLRQLEAGTLLPSPPQHATSPVVAPPGAFEGYAMPAALPSLEPLRSYPALLCLLQLRV